MIKNLSINIKSFFKSELIKNSFWGTIANVTQNILLSVFFIVLARKYSTDDFGNYIIANTLYSIIISFSTLGLGHWFIREIVNKGDNNNLIEKFFKIQLLFGFFFYAVNLIATFSLYQNQVVRTLSLLLGINIIFDNIINSIKSLNIAQSQQRKTFIILVTEAGLKCIFGFVVLLYDIDIIYLSFILILLRIITLNLFIKFGSDNSIILRNLIKVKINYKEFKEIVFSNWSFVVISSLSVINWRIGNIFVSKFLTLKDVTNYEINFKLLSIFYLIPIIVTYSIYPKLVKAFNTGTEELRNIYTRAFYPLTLYGIFCFSFMNAFSEWLIPFLFGEKYNDTFIYCNEMFLIMLIFPTIFLQANMLLTMKLEKLDMLCNVFSLLMNVIICLIGLQYFHSLSVINYAIFFSFFLFHIIQDIILYKRKIIHLTHVLLFNISIVLFAMLYYLSSTWLDKILVFSIFWFLVIAFIIMNFKKLKNFFAPNINPIL